ncbi:MAG: peptidoglycan DD-metalloendopeptidase family protein [Parcubacteria group bacterium]
MKKILFVTLFCLLGFVPKGFAFHDLPHALPFSINGYTYTNYVQFFDHNGTEYLMYCTDSNDATAWNTNNVVTGYTAPYYISIGAIQCNTGQYGSYQFSSYWFYNNWNPASVWLDHTKPLSDQIKTTVNVKNTSNTWTFPSGGSAYGLTGIITNGQLLVPAGTNITYSLTVARSSEAGGGVASLPDGVNEDCNDNSTIRCGECQYNYCNVNFAYNSNVVLKAFPSDGYAFDHWSWNNGANTATDNPHTFTMSGALGVMGVFKPILQFPLSGTLEGRKLAHFYWGDTWTYGECPTGTYKLHAGIDLHATYDYDSAIGEEVNAAHDGVVKKIFTGNHAQWADAIVIESTDGQFTTVYWHVIKHGTLAVNDTVTKGQQIATIADLGSDTHFHFGIRMTPYSEPESYAGALPVANGCDYLAFPEKFIDPETATYE